VDLTDFGVAVDLREELRQEIEATREAYHRLLASIPDEAFSLPSSNPAWTIGEVLFHMSLAPRFLTADLRIILGQAWIARMIGALVPKSLFDWLNETFTRRWARRLSREKLEQAYDKAHASALKALDSLREGDFQKSLQYPDYDPLLSGEVSVERLFRYIKIHFDTHARQIREKVGVPAAES
jgi:uncharacterized damage-inducible protein DinB